MHEDDELPPPQFGEAEQDDDGLDTEEVITLLRSLLCLLHLFRNVTLWDSLCLHLFFCKFPIVTRYHLKQCHHPLFSPLISPAKKLSDVVG